MKENFPSGPLVAMLFPNEEYSVVCMYMHIVFYNFSPPLLCVYAADDCR